MTISSFFSTTNNIKKTSDKYKITPLRVKLLLLADIAGKKGLTIYTVMLMTTISRTSVYIDLNYLIFQKYFFTVNTKPKKHFLTIKGLRTVNDFKNKQRRTKKIKL